MTGQVDAGGNDPTRGNRWVELLRRPPLGVLLSAGALAFAGGGFVLGAAYLAFAGRDVGWVPVIGGLCGGPLALYVALHLIRLTHWAWLVMVLVLILLLASSVWRLAVAPPPPVVPISEMTVEILTLAYLCRRNVRAAFTRR